MTDEIDAADVPLVPERARPINASYEPPSKWVNPWTPERVEKLKEAWADPNKTAQMIADELDCGVTRCAVIGRARRDGLPSKQVGNSVMKRPRRQYKPRRLMLVGPMQGPKFPADRSAHPVHLYDVEPWQCRFILGEASDMLFCGDSKTEGSSYCCRHDRLTHQAGRAPEYLGRKDWTIRRVA